MAAFMSVVISSYQMKRPREAATFVSPPRTSPDMLPPQPRRLAAVDHIGGAGDIAAGVGGEQEEHAVEIARLAEAAGRDVARHLRALGALEKFAVEFGDDKAGRDGVDAHAAEGQLDRERLGELDDAGLGGTVGDDALVDGHAEDRRDVD